MHVLADLRRFDLAAHVHHLLLQLKEELLLLLHGPAVGGDGLGWVWVGDGRSGSFDMRCSRVLPRRRCCCRCDAPSMAKHAADMACCLSVKGVWVWVAGWVGGVGGKEEGKIQRSNWNVPSARKPSQSTPQTTKSTTRACPEALKYSQGKIPCKAAGLAVFCVLHGLVKMRFQNDLPTPPPPSPHSFHAHHTVVTSPSLSCIRTRNP